MQSSNFEPIAVIGFGLKLPQQASTSAGFWDLLIQGRSARTETPTDRFNAEAFYKATAAGDRQRVGTIKTRHGHYIAESLDRFDAPFFSISPHEAECMDPQQRWLLEVAYHALENAGLSIEEVDGSNTSAFVGSFMNDFETMLHKDLDMPSTYHATGKASAILANRISWFYNLKGPSVAINTACSSSLVALHLACESLRTGETSMGLVCGSNLLFTPENTAGLSNLNFLSPDGICYAFDERANGYARGEGIACLVIKPLSAALSNQDPIRALIRGTGVNSDGRTPGISQPSPRAQIDLIRGTYARFGLALDQTRYFEAHGTGTQVGDPIEAEAIATVFRSGQHDRRPIYVGALKSNVGHLEGASGLAAVIKAILVLERGVIPPNIWHERRNPAIKEEWGLHFPTTSIPWPENELRRVSVNSFGFGGTNAHAVIDGAQSVVRNKGPGHLHINGNAFPSQEATKLLVWSAADEKTASRIAQGYKDFLSEHTESRSPAYLEALAFTLSRRRSQFPWRTFCVSDPSQGLGNLSVPPAVQVNSKLQVCFVFTGQGAHWVGMGKELLDYDVFRRSLEESDTLLHNVGCQFSVLETLYSDKGTELNQPEFCQPICTALQVALVELLANWNVHPFAVVGHSSGEVSAAYCAGIITKSHALELAFFRGLAVSATSRMGSPDGGMLATRLSSDKCSKLLADLANSQNPETRNIGIACYNSPQNLTLSGDTNQIERLALTLETEGIISKRLNVSIAYHNAKHMEPAASLYQALIKKLHSSEPGGRANLAPSCYMFSSVRDIFFAPDSDASEVSKPDYWLDNLVCPVRFTQAMQKLASLLENKVGIANIHFIEVGPHSTLKSAIKETLALEAKDWSVERSYSHMLSRQQSAVSTALTVAGRLYSLGLPVDLSAVNNQNSNSNRVLFDLPSYTFDHSKRYWMESRISKDYRFRKYPHHDFLGKSASDWNPLEPQWNNRILLQEQPWIRDHQSAQVSGACVYPAAGMLAMAIEATRQVVHVPHHQPKGYQFRDVVFSRSVVVPDSRLGVEVQFRLRKVEQLSMDLAPCYDFRLYMHDHGQWTQCCRGYITVEHHTSLYDFDLDRSVADEYVKRLSASLSPTEHQRFYARLRDSGLSYGPIFQMDRDIMHGAENEGVGTIDLQRWTDIIEENDQSPCFIHPAALDCIIQVALLGITRGGQVEIPTIVPTAVNHLWISADITRQMVAVSAKSVRSSARRYDVDYISVGAENERPLLIGDLTLTSIEKTANPAVNETKESTVSMYRVDWKPDVNLLGPQTGLFTAQPLQLSQIDGGVSVHSQSPKHLQKYLAWMRHQAGLIRASLDWKDWIFTQPAGSGFQEQLWQKVSSFGPEGRLIVKLCRQILPIIRGEIDALQILFADDMLADYYRQENPPPEVVKGVQEYVDCMAHANPNMRVLEIGGGTGGMTRYILDIIGSHDGSVAERFTQYVFTDISPAFFKDAREKFGRGERIMMKTLDIEKMPVDQGFEKEAFDLVIASNVLHATKDLELTLGNTRQLLKPGGKLILIEGTSPNLLRTSFIFGCLPGWWLSTESYREWGPLVPVDRWNKLLQDSQFTGAEFLIDGPDRENSLSSAVISTARPLVRSNSDMMPTSSDILILRKESSGLQQSLATSICELIKDLDLSVSIHDASELHEVPSGATVVFLQTIDDFVFHELDGKGYQNLKTTVAMANKLLWVTRRHDSPKPGSLKQEAVLGLARSLMSENEGLNIVNLGLEDIEATSRAAQHIRAVLQYYFCADTSLLSMNGEEILEIDGRLCLSRVLPAEIIAKEIWSMQKSKAHMDNDVRSLGNNEIEIQIHAATITPNITTGQPSLGQEINGTITQIGSDVQGTFQVGDPVAAIVPHSGTASIKDRIQCPVGLAHKIPDESYRKGEIVLPLDFLIAYDSLHNCARLQAGDSIIIHDGGSSLSQAAIQLAQFLGAEVFVTFNTKDEEAIADMYSIPASHRFPHQGHMLMMGIKRLTHGRGADVMFTPFIAKKSDQAAWDCMTEYGRVIELVDTNASTSLRAMPPRPRLFKQSVMFARLDIPTLLQDTEKIATILPQVMRLIEHKSVVAVQPLRVLAFSELEKSGGVKAVEQSQSAKTCISFDLNDLTASKPQLFDSTSTYLIAGGLGGLGRSIAKWMISNGVRYLVLLSRQGTESPGADSFLNECATMSVTTFAPKCDISDEVAVSEVIQEVQRRMPPIKGCIQASMVLKSAMFANMTLDQWNEALRSKVQGSNNLDRHLPTQLDFFIFLSSVCGIIGASGQSNYAFGCAYQDALARSKVAMRQKAVSIDLGIVEGVGYTAKHQGVGSFMRSLGLQPISEEYLLSILEYYCDSRREILHPSDAQIVVGIMNQDEGQRSGLVRSRFYSRPLWNHLQRRMNPTLGRSKVVAAQRSNEKDPSSLKLPTAAIDDTLSSTVADGGPDAVSRAICERVSDVLAIDADDIDPAKPLHMYGVDSLVAMELRSWFKEALQKDVAVFDILSNRPIEVLAQEVVGVAAAA
ncbi:type I Iterative Polyketide synthase (PKS) [Aspergillus tubingensis]|nr:type I Iterative Polyketide synthase (PKS) [Aspergillus tubingensis]GLB16565.1 type I Iterative Polyketide synthase (PKS) [Aspergillus tubingensis]